MRAEPSNYQRAQLELIAMAVLAAIASTGRTSAEVVTITPMEAGIVIAPPRLY